MADLNNYLSGGGKNVKLRDQRDRVKAASEDELREVLRDVQPEMLQLRAQAALQTAANPARIGHIRKLVARIHGELSQRERDASANA
ncbi:MAG TPA: 50S ribosomal protein L29 [Abditibacteriaceae bacterium]